jgi:hypothetical protein
MVLLMTIGLAAPLDAAFPVFARPIVGFVDSPERGRVGEPFQVSVDLLNWSSKPLQFSFTPPARSDWALDIDVADVSVTGLDRSVSALHCTPRGRSGLQVLTVSPAGFSRPHAIWTIGGTLQPNRPATVECSLTVSTQTTAQIELRLRSPHGADTRLVEVPVSAARITHR